MRRQLQINAPLTLKKKTTKGAHPRIVAHKFSGTSCLGTSCLGTPNIGSPSASARLALATQLHSCHSESTAFSLIRKSFSASCTSSCKHLTAVSCRHSFHKAMFFLSLELFRLISSLH